jgi:outer membrane immunogenic protein
MSSFKSFLLATAAMVLTAPAFAADLPSRKTAPAPVYVPVFTWTGFYAGLNAGAGWGASRNVVISGPVSTVIGAGGNGHFVGGGQIGYNYQTGNWVFGAETDIQYVGTGSNVSWGNYNWWGHGGTNGGYFGTVRVRAGYAIDRTLIYLTGGLAYGGLNNNPLSGNSTSNAGWTIGAGVEYAFTNNWTAKIEGLYVQNSSSRQTRSYANPAGGVLPAGSYTAVTTNGNGGGVVRVGVNYKF